MAVVQPTSPPKRPSPPAAILAALLIAALGVTALGAAPASAQASRHGHRGKRAHYGIARGRALAPRKAARKRGRSTRLAKAAAPALPPGVLFRGERLADFPIRQSAPGAMTEVPDPAGSGQTVFKMVVSDNDGYPVTPTENPRAEVLSPSTIEAGAEIWWSAKFFLPADFPASTPNFVNLLQGPYGQPWAGTPPFSIKVEGSTLKWQRNSTYDWDVPWQAPLVRNRWVSFLIHERFGPDGWVEMWVDGQPIAFFAGGGFNPNHVAPTQHLAMATEDSSNDALPNAIYLQSYRKKGMFPSLTVYQGPLTIGTTRQAVGG
jgi:hypothetical protein